MAELKEPDFFPLLHHCCSFLSVDVHCEMQVSFIFSLMARKGEAITLSTSVEESVSEIVDFT